MKKAIAFVLSLAMCLLLIAGCSSSTNSSAGSTGSDADEEPYEIVIENLTLGQEMADLEEIESKINEITLPAINVTVKFLNTHIKDHTTKVTLAAAGGDKIDIVTTGRTYDLTQMVADGVIIPLEDLMAEYAPILSEKTADVIDACRLGDHVWCIPGKIYFFETNGLIYNKDMADEYGIEVKEYPDRAELERIAAELKKANPNMYLCSMGTAESGDYFNLYDSNWYTFGERMYGGVQKTDDTATVVNVFETENYREYLHMARHWYEEGWVVPDSMTSGINTRDYMVTEQVFCEIGATSPMQYGTLQPQYDFTIGMESFSAPEANTASVQEHGWGIHINCERPDKAMQLLELMYSNEELVNLFSSGIEGKDYVHVSDRIITYPDGVDGSNVGYTRIFSDFGDMMQIYQWVPVTEEAFDECMELSRTATKSPYFGYSFDTSELGTQISNCSTTLNEYLPGLIVGIFTDEQVDEQLDKMNAALKASGIDDIIAENQRQLNEWLANNK